MTNQNKRGSVSPTYASWRYQLTNFISASCVTESVKCSYLIWMQTALLLYFMIIAQTCQFAAQVMPMVSWRWLHCSTNFIQFSSAFIFCMISYCLKCNMLLKIFILICKLLPHVEIVHPETFVSIYDGTSCSNYI